VNRSLYFSAILCVLVFAAARAPGETPPRWTKVLSGDPVAGPVALGDRTVTVTDDRSITCLDREGNFLWSGRLPGGATPYLTVFGEGYACALSRPGNVSLYSADGNPLWRASGSGTPVADPYPGRDGRFFVLYEGFVRCFAQNGLQLWKASLPSAFTGPVGETGDGDLLVGCAGPVLARLSPYGELRETLRLDSAVTSIAPLPFGFATGTPSGSVEAWDLRSAGGNRGSERVWSLAAGAPVSALRSVPGTLYALSADGSIRAVNPTDGAPSWQAPTGFAVSGAARLSSAYGQLYVLAPALALGLSERGSVLWSLRVPAGQKVTALASDGSVYAAGSGWSVSAWTGERRIGTASGKADGSAASSPGVSANYGILSGTGREAAWLAHPDTGEVREFFGLVAESLAFGTGKAAPGADFVGVDEPRWARRLEAIVKNGSFGSLVPVGVREGFYDTERARAASLLGQLGSTEYRDFLVERAYDAPGETLAVGILYGLAATGGDRGGKVAAAVKRLARGAGVSNDTVNRAVCDALFALIRYAPDREAAEYAAMLVGFTQEPYGAATREYARQVVGNIVQ